MKAAFIDKTRIEKKHITALNLKQLGPRPEQMAVQLSLSINDETDKLQYKKGEFLDIFIQMAIRMADHDHADFDPKVRCEAAEVFVCELEIRLLAEILADLKLKKSLAEEYTHELLSLTYDDFRFIIEDNISKTDFRGFYLPIDFREVLQGSTVTKAQTPS